MSDISLEYLEELTGSWWKLTKKKQGYSDIIKTNQIHVSHYLFSGTTSPHHCGARPAHPEKFSPAPLIFNSGSDQEVFKSPFLREACNKTGKQKKI